METHGLETKAISRRVIDLLLIGLFMMKRGNLSYRFQGKNYTAKMLYELIKRKMTAQKGQRFFTTQPYRRTKSDRGKVGSSSVG